MRTNEEVLNDGYELYDLLMTAIELEDTLEIARLLTVLEM